MDIPTITPRALRPGDTVGIVAPAGPMEQSEALRQGIATLEGMGFKARFEERIFQALHYLAGDDEERSEELMRHFEDPEIHAVVGLRGGYGCSRLIPLLEENRLRPYPKIFMGFSDLTTLHLYFRRRFGWTTIHGPMAGSFSLGNIDSAQKNHLQSLWTDPQYKPKLSFPQLETWSQGVSEGILTGGCLSLVVSSIGTLYEVKTEGKILFLEDFGEPAYRLDRMLTHLLLAGKLNRLSGVLLGEFHQCEPADENYTATDVLRDLLCRLGIPVLANFPAGHGESNWAIPLGAKIRMDADARFVEFLEPATA